MIRNVKLLSFGADEDEDGGEEEEGETFVKKPIYRPECGPSHSFAQEKF